MKDNDVLDSHKIRMAQDMFFVGSSKPDDTMEGIKQFLDGAKDIPPQGEDLETDAPPEPKRFDFEFDAQEIYASFVPSLTLKQLQELHWYDFVIRLRNLPAECPFHEKIRVRFYDLTNLQGKHRTDMEIAKAKVQLPEEYTRDELKAIEEFDKEWGSL
jgi:hypothetical protein